MHDERSTAAESGMQTRLQDRGRYDLVNTLISLGQGQAGAMGLKHGQK